MSLLSRSHNDHLHPTVRRYVDNPDIARGYDGYFTDHPLFAYDRQFIDRYLGNARRVLDVGCGTGRHLVHLADRGIRTVGLDLSAHMLEEARANLRVTGARASLVQADFHHLPLGRHARFDGILLLFSTLGLVQTAARRLTVLANLRRHLAPDGWLLLHVHNQRYHGQGHPSLWGQIRRLGGRQEPGDSIMPNYRGLQDLFLHCFTRREIEALLVRSGYAVGEMQPLNARRNGLYRGDDPDEEANGFLIAARPGGD